jgi:hypothetical protein
MYPSLSRETKSREAAAAQQRAEQKKRSEQFAADLRELGARLAREREGRR